MIEKNKKWDDSGAAQVAIIMIALNEAHHMRQVLENLKGFAAEVFLVDSYSSDETIDIALEYGVHVVQKKFEDFSKQWNFALENLPVQSPWTMKLDPDERLTDELKEEIRGTIKLNLYSGYVIPIRLWFMGKQLPAKLNLVRLWQTGKAHFSDVTVNEHAIINGTTGSMKNIIEHHDSPNLHHWMEKQNKYTTAEASASFKKADLAMRANLFGNSLERRMWLKKYYSYLPFRHVLMFLYCWIVLGAWRAGYAGFVWARLRAFVFRMIEYKKKEMKRLGTCYDAPVVILGKADKRVKQYP